MLNVSQSGLYCAIGDFYIDPSRSVDCALITHAHSDHARPGCQVYYCADASEDLIRMRVGKAKKAPSIRSFPYGEPFQLEGVRVSFHPAGHVLGSAQVRMEYRGEVWVVSGDYKTQADPTCAAFEPVRCDTFITESTFGLPVYRWPEPAEVFAEINTWWQENQARGRTSVLYGYSLGKAQRLLAGVDARQGPILVHRAVAELLPAYTAAGVHLPSADPLTPESVRATGGKALVIAPPAAESATWLRGLGEVSTAFASGWMLLRGTRRRRGVQRGFALSDHADWPGLIGAIRATQARRVWVTHGEADALVRWLRENGWDAQALAHRPDGHEH